MKLKMLLPILTSLCILLSACRVRQTSEATQSRDSLNYEQGRYLEVFQVVERYDSLGRLRERQTTTAREQDSTHLKQTKHHEQSKRTETKPPSALGSSLWTSWRALFLLLLFGIAIGAYAYRRFTQSQEKRD